MITFSNRISILLFVFLLKIYCTVYFIHIHIPSINLPSLIIADHLNFIFTFSIQFSQIFHSMSSPSFSSPFQRNQLFMILVVKRLFYSIITNHCTSFVFSQFRQEVQCSSLFLFWNVLLFFITWYFSINYHVRNIRDEICYMI